MSRIKLDSTTFDCLFALSEGNPGAVRACMEMMEASPQVDPDSAMGPFSPLLSLDTEEIYGARIWMLYKDVCGEDVVKALACLRAVQLGQMTTGALNHAIDNCGDGVDVGSVLVGVQRRLPKFAARAA